MYKRRICVIGGGASGLVAIKECLAGDFEVSCFEKSSTFGGLWRFREDTDEYASVMRSTVINSSKEMSAFSDFPPPDHFPNFMHNSVMIDYIERYAAKFKLATHVQFKHEVLRVTRDDEYEETGRWMVTVRDLATSKVRTELFDGVLVCSGHHDSAVEPTFPGQGSFTGQILHSRSYKTPGQFDGKRVVVLGLGNSAGDIAVELSHICPQVFLSTRRGTWVVNRVGPKGRPIDSVFTTRFSEAMGSVSFGLKSTIYQRMLNERFDHKAYNVQPEHGALGQDIMVNDSLPNKLLSGTVKVKSCIERFEGNGVVFKGESMVTPCDVVILATGYKFDFPFFDKDTEPMLAVDGHNKIDLYKFVFPADLSHPSLAFVGLVQPIGSVFPISELHVRWFVQLMNSSCPPLPPKNVLLEDIERKKVQLKQRYFQSAKHTVQVDVIPHMDDIAEQFGARPNLLKVLMSGDISLWKTLLFKTCAPYQYRLEGPGQWSGAREALLDIDKRIARPLQTRADFEQSDESGSLMRLISGASSFVMQLFTLISVGLMLMLSFL